MAGKKKSNPLGAIDKCIGPKCSLCCTIFSFFGLIVLMAVGGLIKEGNAKVQGETVVYDYLQEPISKSAFIAGAIYAGIVFACGVRYLFVCRRVVENDDEDEE